MLLALAVAAAPTIHGQELEPNSYAVSPVGVNALVVANTVQWGDIAFDPAGPIDDAEATVNVSVLAYARTLDVGGRSGSFTAVLPYVRGDLEGIYIGEFAQVRRSGLADSRFRLAVNLFGGPAMNLKEFAGYRPKTNLGVSLSVITPTGQYDPLKLINIGSNRWAFKPEVGLSHRFAKWTVEAYGGVWKFTDNEEFFGGRLREQELIGSTQFHLTYTFRPRLWLSFNTNFYFGGRTIVDKTENFDLQTNSRVGVTLAVPLRRRHALKLAFSRGAYTTIGADFGAVGVSYQYTWGGGL